MGTLFWTSLSIGLLHTLVGPDHYIPFIVIGRARKWSLFRTSLLTFVCGLGHVGSSALLGLIGALIGMALHQVQGWEESRGDWAAWGLIIFGTGYMLWGIRQAMLKGSHGHIHLHKNGVLHAHGHDHAEEGHPPVHEHPHDHAHAHGHDHSDMVIDKDYGEPASWKSLTPWILFVIFVFGPCEPLIPLFFASAVAGRWHEVLVVTLAYSAATLLAMHAMVTMFWLGLSKVSLGPLERWSNAMAGGVILLAGLGMVFLGL